MATKSILGTITKQVKDVYKRSLESAKEKARDKKERESKTSTSNINADYIEKEYPGGLNAYKALQQQRYDEAIAKGDNDLLQRLEADSQRVGFVLIPGKSNSSVIKTPSKLQEKESAEEQAKEKAEEQAKETQRLQDKLFEEQRKAAIEGLKKSREAGLSALRSEETTIEPAYAGARSGVRATSERGAQQFANFLAQRGLTRGGGAALGETQRLGAQQAALGGLAQQETNTLSDIARRRTGIEAGYASDVQATEAGLQAQQLQQQLATQQAAQQARTQAQQQAFENALKLAGITGQIGGAPTLAGQQQAFGQQLSAAQFNENIRQFDANLDLKTKQFEANNALDLRQQSFNEAQERINNAIRQGQLSVSQGNALLAKKRFEAEQDPNSLDNQLKQAKLTELQTGTTEEQLTATGYRTNPDFAEDLSQIINATPEQKQTLRQQLQANAQAFITKYGLDGYRELLNETGAF